MNPVDPSRTTPSMGKSALRHQFGIPWDAKVVSFIGRLVPEKHPEKLIEALAYLPGWYGVIQGTGAMEPEIRLMARSTHGRIRFVPWNWHVGDTLAVSDVFLLLSDFEGFPLAVGEAWMSGTPTVLSWMNFVRHLVADHHTDFAKMVEAGKPPKAIAECIQAATAEKQQAITAMARAFAWENLAITAIAKQYELFFTECLHDFRLRNLMPGVEVL
jgi:glycosyltransferase involved in cell wall biosynthesis